MNDYIQEELHVDKPLNFLNYFFFLIMLSSWKRLYTFLNKPPGLVWTFEQVSSLKQIREGILMQLFNKTKHAILLLQIVIDDIVFSANNKFWCKTFFDMVHNVYDGRFMVILSLNIFQLEKGFLNLKYEVVHKQIWKRNALQYQRQIVK